MPRRRSPPASPATAARYSLQPPGWPALKETAPHEHRTNSAPARHPRPGRGRSYPMRRIAAVFKADGAETQSRYAISEWWLEPHTQGPGLHAHPEDDVFHVLEGTLSICIGNTWADCNAGLVHPRPGRHAARLRDSGQRAHGAAEPLDPRRVRAAHAGHRAMVRRASAAGCRPLRPRAAQARALRRRAA